MNNANDKLWVETVLDAAERGSVDAMNEMGNICNRWAHFAESMYWYAMANAHPGLKKVCRFETLSNDEDGVMHVVRQLLARL